MTTETSMQMALEFIAKHGDALAGWECQDTARAALKGRLDFPTEGSAGKGGKAMANESKAGEASKGGWTPGPWHVTGSKKAQEATTTACDLGVCAESGPVAKIDPNKAGMRSPRENAANARLIAAAPELARLVAELADVLIDDSRECPDAPFWREDGEGTRMIRDARALLARVKGSRVGWGAAWPMGGHEREVRDMTKKDYERAASLVQAMYREGAERVEERIDAGACARAAMAVFVTLWETAIMEEPVVATAATAGKEKGR